MRPAWLILLLALPQDSKKDLREACAAMDQAKSYRFSIRLTVGGEERLSVTGEYEAPGLIHTKSERSETARNGDRKLTKGKDGEWKEPGPLARRLDDPPLPHEWVRKLAEQCPALKKEKSSKIGATTVDLYVHSLAHDAARKSYESAGLPLWAAAPDWSKTQNGLVFFVGRDDLIHRVEQRFDGRGKDDQKIDNRIVIEFSEFGKAKVSLPEDVRAKLGTK
jgi:hypothetical protein